MIIGVIGAENSHTVAFAKMFNIDQRIPDWRIGYVWGETPEFAKDASERGQIPHIVEHTSDMLGKVDAIVVNHRHAKYHLEAAWPYVEHGTPAFIDKPFCYRAEEGRRFLDMARRSGTPVTSYSTLPFQERFREFIGQLPALGTRLAGSTYGAGDLESEYGGIFFYGVHQAEMALNAFGYDVESAMVTHEGDFATASLFYPSGHVVTMALMKRGAPGFGIHAVGTEGALHMPIKMDEFPYLTAIETFVEMFRTGNEPLTHDQLLRPVQVLEALEKSVESGALEAVEQA